MSPKEKNNSVEKNVSINGKELEMYMWYNCAPCASLTLGTGFSRAVVLCNHFTICKVF